ncbi:MULTISPECIES: hypothetical protein [unclassified Thioalkalivibrio]|uniref:hypothetical protein n=1 Tax=unclassified Thioalkalivibrio TaxID=2621013 RepID=UPI000361649F|nr:MULTISPECIES: hypothetical protein [unclassified Thioalkalivibrio]
MSDNGSRRPSNFVIGNIFLAAAALMLFFFVTLWEYLGVIALVLWMALAAIGVYFIVKDKDINPGGPPN